MNVSALNTRCRTYLGTAEDDPQYTDTILLAVAGEAYESLCRDIQELNPGWFATTVSLTPASSTSRVYAFASQSPAITDFNGWLELRHTDADGYPFREVPYALLNEGGAYSFALLGTDDTPTIQTSPDAEAGITLYLKYVQWPASLTSVSSTPSKISTRFHDVVALEMASIAFGFGGEQRMPPEVFARWQDRRGQLLQSVSRRGVQVAQVRVDATKEF